MSSPDLATFDATLAAIQRSGSNIEKLYRQWRAGSPGEASRWDAFVATLRAGSATAAPQAASAFGSMLQGIGNLAVGGTATAPPVPSTAYRTINFEGAFPEPGWYTSLFFPTGASIGVVNDPLGLEGKVLKTSCAYVPTLATTYTSASLQSSAYSANDNAEAHASRGQETWYRYKFMAPAGNHFCNGLSNWMIEWHTATGPGSSGMFAYGDYPLTPAGTTAPKITFVLRSGASVAAPTERYFPGNTADLAAAAGIPFQPDHWYDSVFHFKWADDATGVFQWWLDGKLLADYAGPTFYADPAETSYSIAVYNYRYNVTGNSDIYWALIANGPSAASVGFAA